MSNNNNNNNNKSQRLCFPNWKIKINTSDIVVNDYERKTCLLTDISKPTDVG